MARLIWDESGKRFYETGVRNGVLYVADATGVFGKGVAWNGLTAVTESPTGAEATPIYADDIKYLNMVSAEEFTATIEAYTYPTEFEICDGSASLHAADSGVTIGQQARRTFCFVYKTVVGNDLLNNDYGYKIHVLYNCIAAPSEKAYATINDTPEAVTFSWEINTTPVNVTGLRPTANLVIDSTKCDPTKLAEIEDSLFGTTGTSPVGDPKILMPDEIVAILAV